MNITEIKNAVISLEKDQSVDLLIAYSAKSLPSRLKYNTQDPEGFYRVFRCQCIPGGVRVTCIDKFKITNVRAV
jgi:hypothetical protein